ncbi:hypothetical protein FraQA3DRAFT_2109 [Frankia sp. QA3]|nr:hypothetical protein FraQA3DRAFT_2109 [Frankia sp. QA3]
MVGCSRLPAMVSRVDLPDPLGPMIATISPAWTDRSTLVSAWTWAVPEPYTFVTPRSWRIGVAGVGILRTGVIGWPSRGAVAPRAP